MKKKEIIVVIVGMVILVLVLFFGSQKQFAGEAINQKLNTLSSLQAQACTTADKAGTCNSRLVEIGIILPEQCCQQYGKCCS